MDLDELLARQLQHAELAEGRPAPVLVSSKEQEEKAKISLAIESSLDLCSRCEQDELQALALSLIPLDELSDLAQRAKLLNNDGGSTAGPAPDVEDYLARELTRWFKKSFFKWVNAPACSFCGGKTKAIGIQKPTAEELQHQASRTEVYSCTACETQTRFPRYNDVGKLLETRCGRCGEWANAALLCCRAVGLQARYIWDSEDHVWTEYWSHAMQRWVHLDFCEGAYDKPLLYEGGWKKKLKYVLAICPTGVVDVSPRYTRQLSEVSKRRAVPDSWLHAQTSKATRELRASFPPEILQALDLRDISENLELLGRATSDQTPLSAEQAAALGLTGRQTGDAEWRRARGEDGLACTTSGPAPPSPGPECTLWQPLPQQQPHDEHVPASAGPPSSVCARAGRLLGGACRAQGENSGEGAAQAFDGMAHTKWLDFKGGGPGGHSWLEFRLMGAPPTPSSKQQHSPPSSQAATSPLLAYDLISSNDCPERDPLCWVVEGLSLEDEVAGNFSDSAWHQLDAQQGVAFTERHQVRTFSCVHSPRNSGHSSSTNHSPSPASTSASTNSHSTAAANQRMASTPPPPPSEQQQTQASGALSSWRRFRLCITATANPAAANSVQLAAWNLYGPQVPCPLGSAAAEHQGDLLLSQQSGKGGVSGQKRGSVEGAGAGEIAAGAVSAACARAAQGVVDAHKACLLGAEALGTLRKVATNVADHPEDPRYRRLRASKVLQLAASPEALCLLLHIGFRPIVAPQPPPNQDQEPALFFVLESGPGAVQRAQQAASVLSRAL